MSEFQVGPETWVEVRTLAFDAEGEAIGEAEVIGFVFGLGALFPKVERALEGKSTGDRITLELQPKDAFGERKTDRILEVDRSDFPADVAPGDRFEVENEAGGILVLQVLDVLDDAVVVDTNHPFCGQTIRLEVEILGVRLVEESEVNAAMLEQEAEASGELRGGGDSAIPDVSVSSLVRRRGGA